MVFARLSLVFKQVGLIFLVVLLGGCFHPQYSEPSQDCKKWFESDVSVDSAQYRQFVKTGSLDEVYAFYRCKAINSFYSVMDLAILLAYRGEPLAKYMLQKIKYIDNRREMEAVFDVYEQMAVLNTYSVGDDEDVMESLGSAADLFDKNYEARFLRRIYYKIFFRSSKVLDEYVFVCPECSDIIRRLYMLPFKEQFVKFNTLDAEKQYVAMACGLESFQLDTLYLYNMFVLMHKNTNDYIKCKLASATDEYAVRVAIGLLHAMKSVNVYDFTNDRSLVELMLSQAQLISDKYERKSVVESIKILMR